MLADNDLIKVIIHKINNIGYNAKHFVFKDHKHVIRILYNRAVLYYNFTIEYGVLEVSKINIIFDIYSPNYSIKNVKITMEDFPKFIWEDTDTVSTHLTVFETATNKLCKFRLHDLGPQVSSFGPDEWFEIIENYTINTITSDNYEKFLAELFLSTNCRFH